MILLWRNTGNSIHIVKFRLCKSAEKNCSETGSYYSGPAYIRTSGTRTGQRGFVNSGRRRDVRHNDTSTTLWMFLFAVRLLQTVRKGKIVLLRKPPNLAARTHVLIFRRCQNGTSNKRILRRGSHPMFRLRRNKKMRPTTWVRIFLLWQNICNVK